MYAHTYICVERETYISMYVYVCVHIYIKLSIYIWDVRGLPARVFWSARAH